MAGSVNKVILIGHLGRDPDIRSMQNGGKVCNLSLATSESWKDKQSGERKEKTEWHRIVLFNENLITLAERYLKKGSKVYIEGQLETRKYNDKDGAEKYTTEVVLRQFRGEITLLDSKSESDARGGGERSDDRGGQQQQRSGGGGGSKGGGKGEPDWAADLNDDVPF